MVVLALAAICCLCQRRKLSQVSGTAGVAGQRRGPGGNGAGVCQPEVCTGDQECRLSCRLVTRLAFRHVSSTMSAHACRLARRTRWGGQQVPPLTADLLSCSDCPSNRRLRCARADGNRRQAAADTTNDRPALLQLPDEVKSDAEAALMGNRIMSQLPGAKQRPEMGTGNRPLPVPGRPSAAARTASVRVGCPPLPQPPSATSQVGCTIAG